MTVNIQIFKRLWCGWNGGFSQPTRGHHVPVRGGQNRWVGKNEGKKEYTAQQGYDLFIIYHLFHLHTTFDWFIHVQRSINSTVCLLDGRTGADIMGRSGEWGSWVADHCTCEWRELKENSKRLKTGSSRRHDIHITDETKRDETKFIYEFCGKF